MIAALSTIAIGVAVLLGWGLDVASLKSVLPGFVSMKPNTALGFVFAGFSLAFLARRPRTAIGLRLSQGCAAAVTLIGLLTLGEYLLGVDLGIDQLLFREAAHAIGTLVPGRMAPVSASNFVLVGIALLLAGYRRVEPVAQLLAFISGLMGLLPLIGYLYGATGLFGVGHYTQLALHTAGTFLVVSGGILFLDVEQGFMRTVTSKASGGWLMRRLLPFMFGLPIVLGWVRVHGQRIGRIDTETGVALSMTVFIALLPIVAWWFARELNREDDALRRAQDLLLNVTEGTSDAVYVKDVEGRYLMANTATARFVGKPVTEFLGKDDTGVFPADEARALMESDRKTMKGPPRMLEETLTTSQGVRTFLSTKGPVRDARGNVIGLFGIARDITERAKADAAFRENSVLFAESQRAASIGSYRLDVGTGIWTSSAVLDLIFGIDQQYVRSIDGWTAIVHPEDREMMRRYLAEEVMTARKKFDKEYRIVRQSDGAIRWVLGLGALTYGADGSVVSMYGTIQDVTERRLTEARLRQSEAKFKALFEQAGDYILVLQENDGGVPIIVDANDAAVREYGYSRRDFIGRPLTLIDSATDDEVRKRLSVVQRHGQGVLEVQRRRQDGSIFAAEASLREVSVGGEHLLISIERNVSERKRIEETQRKVQQLEALGTLAGGIAHDFNNLLTGIVGSLSLLKTEQAAHPEQIELLHEAETACQTAKGLARQLLTFASGGAPLIACEALVPLVEQAATFATRGSSVKCVVTASDGPLYANIDRDQIAQVIHNLAINAVQAMPGGGTFSLELSLQEVGENQIRSLEAGRYVRLLVRDTGAGMPDEVRSRVFDPYFSTKPMGHGLGLTVCYSIIAKHGGHIDLESSKGDGTVFTILLPAATPEPVAAVEVRDAGVPRASGRILVMDDEPAVAKVLERVLKRLGCAVEWVTDGEAAIAAYRDASGRGAPFDVVIMDLTIPGGIGGLEALRRLREIEPEIRAVVTSGYSTDPILANHRDYGFRATLAKPFRVADVEAALAQALR